MKPRSKLMSLALLAALVLAACAPAATPTQAPRAKDVIDTYVFRALRQVGDFGMAGAVGLYQSFVGFVMVFLANWLVKRMDPEKSIF